MNYQMLSTIQIQQLQNFTYLAHQYIESFIFAKMQSIYKIRYLRDNFMYFKDLT